MLDPDESPNFTPSERESIVDFNTALADLIVTQYRFTETDENELRVATNRGFRRALKDLAWKAGFLHYLTIEQQHRVQQLIDELDAICRKDQERSTHEILQGMVESIEKRPPVQ